MMKHFLQSLALVLLGSTPAQAQQIDIVTDEVQLSFTVGNDQKLYQSYFGQTLGAGGRSQQKRQEAYIAWGTNDLFEPALRVTHVDGNPALAPVYAGHTSVANADGSVLWRIALKDSLYPVEVTLCVMAYPRENVLRTWSEISHREQGDITLHNVASGMLHFDAGSYWLTQFHGDWAAEMHPQESRLTSGIKIIDSKLGTRAHMFQTPVFMLSLDRPATETAGEVLAGTLEWSGNFRFLFEVDHENALRIVPGINPFASEYRLSAGEVFTTPAFVFTCSTGGKGKASRNLHRWARRFGILNGTGERMTLLNNWEATYFDFDERKLKRLLADAKQLGVDLFLLDDGWFANKYPRNSDKTGLGDWQPNRQKLPNGIGSLVKAAQAEGVQFGIWLEPEMVSPQSELYEQHPEWILKLPGRAEHYYRSQLVLDVANPQVQDFIYQTVNNLLRQNPGIAYIKWDCNRMMTNTYSPYLKEKQSQVYIDYQLGLYRVLARLREQHPRLPMMLCAGGGGRADYGALKYFTEFWPSDNTDGLERVYIQWGYSHFFPAVALSAHVTSWGRQSIKFRTDVAMQGRLGFDIDLGQLSEQDLRFCQQAVAGYKRLGSVIQQGDLYRLVSPYEEQRAVLMYVDELQDRAVLFAYTTHPRAGERFRPVRLQGLDPDKQYDVREINIYGNAQPTEYRSLTGAQLMTGGIPVSSAQPLSSRVFEIGVEN